MKKGKQQRKEKQQGFGPNQAALLLIAIIICELAGFVGSVFTAPNIAGWYEQLAKPDFRPPNWLFFPVWTILYALMGVSLYIIYTSKDRMRTAALYAFGVQLFLNVLWSFVFFGMRSPFYGLVTIVLLWASIAYMIFKFFGISKAAALLQVPYLFWVTVAALLNFFIFLMN